MLQLFFKTSKISTTDWAMIYQKVVQLTADFPIPLMRLESYDGFSRELSKLHDDLIVNKGEEKEFLSFYGDRITNYGGKTIRFHKNWEQQQKNFYSELKEADENKSLYWLPPKTFKDDGSVPKANGQLLGSYMYIDELSSIQRCFMIAVASMLEYFLPGKVFLVIWEAKIEEAEKMVEWLRGEYGEHFEFPIYLDKKRLLTTFLEEYEDKKDAVSRIEHLYRKQFFRNMKFAIENIGYEPAIRFYAEVLNNYNFGTFGFSDVINPWIAATEDLESTLNLISESKRLLLEEGSEKAKERAEEYDFTKVLKDLLHQFVLWTPEQREELAVFYTNEEAIETGEEDLFGIMRRMMGHRVDICPIVANEEELFEAFMYHDPKNGKVFKEIIDNWVAENQNSFEEFKRKKEATAQKIVEQVGEEKLQAFAEKDKPKVLADAAIDFIEQYAPHEQFIIEKAITINPFYVQQEETVAAFYQDIADLITKREDNRHIEKVTSQSLEDLRSEVYYYLKKKRMYVTPSADFKDWVEAETDKSVLYHVRLLFTLKIYQQQQAYARSLIVQDKKYWKVWEQGERFAVEVNE